MEEHVDTLMGIILPYANFVIFLGLAIYFFRKPARAAAQKKRDAFTKLMGEATAARDAATAKLAELRQREAALDAELNAMRDMSKQAADLEAAKLVADAERLAAHLKAEAGRIAHAEVGKARAELRREIVEAVTAGVTKRLETELNGEAQMSLVHKKIGDLKQVRADS